MIETLLGHVDTLLLLACAGGALAGGALMLVLRQPMRVAMALIATMLFLAGIYGLLGMHFIAAFQVLIYVGAVMLFMVYVIMLLEVRESDGARYSRLLLPGAAGLLVLLFVLAASVWRPLPSRDRMNMWIGKEELMSWKPQSDVAKRYPKASTRLEGGH